MRRRRLVIAAGAVLALVCAAVVVGALRVTAAPPAPAVTLQAGGSLTVGASPPTITVPIRGSMVLVASGRDLVMPGSDPLVSDGADAVRPIASVAKTLTALVVLDHKPLTAAAPGPEYTMTSQDVTFYTGSVAAGGSSTYVSAGEQFSERQLLEALMLPSGNNIADTLATWVAGSVAAFVTLENSSAQSLGMSHTTITDPSGFDSGTLSTAADLVKLGAAAIANPALAAIVVEHHVTLPSGDTVPNFDTALGQPGWLGIKTGDSDAAGGCFLFAARREPAGDGNPDDAITIVGAVLGERSLMADASGDDNRAAAIFDAERAVDTAMQGFVAVTAPAVSSTPTVSGGVTTEWGNSSTVSVGAAAVVTPTVVRMGTPLTLQASPSNVAAPLQSGMRVGSVNALIGGRIALAWSVITDRAVDAPGFMWRLQHD